ncbi:pyrroline-5-carboxylate reductase [Phaeobacter inhibens]|uniref:pyrroline-5-carboxylate reductase n=1 Tax=Phaeobacter inhibens TaxID=221822 RepID=UPI0021A39A66|nr:pyrroline-5-carboxylate reductase [Phaeobacter inhibens]UWR51974.1 pyrroline-5-carboxylate reductase [Phaeobacter inhibens]
MNPTTLFIGAGNMGSAIIKGYLSAGGKAGDISIVDPFAQDSTKQALAGAHFYSDFESLDPALRFDMVVLATKPQVFLSVSQDIERVTAANGTIVSIMAGIGSETISTAVGGNLSVVRCMPNMAASKGYSANVAFTKDETKKQGFERLFGGSGTVRWVDNEDQIHFTTAVSGSGPAYFFAFVEALAASGTNAGLDSRLAMDLAIDTLIGASELLKSNRDPETLRKSVTSKGGTTAAALEAFAHNNNLQAVVDDATSAAILRSRELGNPA